LDFIGFVDKILINYFWLKISYSNKNFLLSIISKKKINSLINFICLMQQNKSRLSKKLISASEIGQYNYCSVAWFLHRCGYEPLSESLEVGAKAHVELGNILDYTKQNTQKSKILSYIGYILLIIGGLFFLFEVIL
jgi:hypothetical protein